MLTKFTMLVLTTNSAFGDRPAVELARLLRRTAVRLEQGETEGKLLDVNGNSVGGWSWNE